MSIGFLGTDVLGQWVSMAKCAVETEGRNRMRVTTRNKSRTSFLLGSK